jgi:hypothetical protein
MEPEKICFEYPAGRVVAWSLWCTNFREKRGATMGSSICQSDSIHEERGVTVKPVSKWKGLSERVSKLKDGGSFVIETERNPYEEAIKIRNGLRRIRACFLIRRSVRVVEGKIVITRLGTIRTLSWIERDTAFSRLPNVSALFTS